MTGPQELLNFSGRKTAAFKGQKGAILNLLLSRRGQWIPAPELASIALQYCARIKELRESGYEIANRTKRVGGQVHGAFCLVSCPGEAVQQ